MAFLADDIANRYPTLASGDGKVTLIRAGIGGEQAFQGAKRLKALLEQHKPTVCVVGYGTCEVTFKNEASYVPAMKDIVKQLKEAGIAITIVSPPPPSPRNWKQSPWPASQFVEGIPPMVAKAGSIDRRQTDVLRAVTLPDEYKPPYHERQRGTRKESVAPADLRGVSRQDEPADVLHQQVTDHVVGRPETHDGAALFLAQPLGNATDTPGPTGRLSQTVEEHEDHKGRIRVGKSKDDVDDDTDTETAQQEHPRPPPASDVAV